MQPASSTDPHPATGSRRHFLAKLACSATSALALSPRVSRAAEAAGTTLKLPRCQVTPLPDSQTAIHVAGREIVRWHFGAQYPRPFLYPFNGPSGFSLTRMGHPGAPNHDHHRSIWFAHQNVDGTDFWSENTPGRIRQKDWLCYEDGDAQCAMAVRLGWFADERELMEQLLVAVLRPGEKGEYTLDLQSTFRASSGPVRLGKTNFGFLAVRVAKSISEFFGGGRLTDSEGRRGEAAIFGQRARWMDYSGPIGEGRTEGITYFDHPKNPGSPAHWHVREDGWMGASFCMKEDRTITPEKPLRLRYLLHAHRGRVDSDRAAKLLAEFVGAPLYEVVPSKAKHRQFELRPAPRSGPPADRRTE